MGSGEMVVEWTFEWDNLRRYKGVSNGGGWSLMRSSI